MIGQVHAYFMGTMKHAPASIQNFLVELDLVKTFHWLPQDIAKIPYKWLQKFYLFEKLKTDAVYTKGEIEKLKSKNKKPKGK